MTIIFSNLLAVQDNSNLYMVLEFVTGGEMFLHLRQSGKFSLEFIDELKFYRATVNFMFSFFWQGASLEVLCSTNCSGFGVLASHGCYVS